LIFFCWIFSNLSVTFIGEETKFCKVADFGKS
jgi:hypothetical protein